MLLATQPTDIGLDYIARSILPLSKPMPKSFVTSCKKSPGNLR